MLDQKDLELIAEIVERVTNPIKNDVKVLQRDVKSLKLTLENETELEKLKTRLEEIA